MTIEKICETINGLINKARAPLATIPGILLACSAIKRPGLSAMLMASEVIRRQGEAGAPMGGRNKDGSPSVTEAMERIRMEAIVDAIKMMGKVQTAIPIGGIEFMGTGASIAGPVVVKGFNINVPHGIGIFG